MKQPLCKACCPYLRSEWSEVWKRSKMSTEEILAIWRRRVQAAHAHGLYSHRRNRKGTYYQFRKFIWSGIDNPYQTEDAHRILLNAAVRHRDIEHGQNGK